MIWLLLACSTPADTSIRGPGRDADPDGAALVDVAHERELRGVWVATVSNINWPSRTGLAAEAQQAELIAMLDTMQAAGLNTMVFQVRPEGDALYASELEPWSRFLSGTQGVDPGYDPLAYLVAEAHARNIEVHAWFNPYRARSSASTTAVAPHMAIEFPEYAYTYGAYTWMDPGARPVQDRTAVVLVDVVSRYDVDGVHFDDYFYPYPDGTAFPDDVTYAASGTSMSLGDWRRDNVNTLVERVSAEVAAARDDVRFGISPFGIYRPGIPEGITGLDQYAEIYADPVKWIDEGWLDYSAPQLYWPSTQTAQAYEPLVAWWSAQSEGGPYLFPGNYLSKLGSSSAWSVDELRLQVELARERRDQGCQGQIWYNIDPLMEDTLGIQAVFRDELYPTPALTPVLASARGATIAAPTVSLDGATAKVSHPGRIRAWVVYEESGGAYTIDRIVPGSASEIALGEGTWAISAADTRGVESQGVVVTR